MNNFAKGALLGATNVLVVAFMIGALAGHSARWSAEAFITVTFLGIVPGTIVGAVLGLLAGRLDSQPVALRLLALASLAIIAVIVLGAYTEPELIGPAVIPTFVLTALLERWTRRDCSQSELTGVGKGALLGLANVFVIACLAGIAMTLDPPRRFSGEGLGLGFGEIPGSGAGIKLAQLIVIVGLVPGTVAGALLGGIANAVQCARLLRLAILAAFALVVVAWLGAMTNRVELVVSACIPTLIAAALIERWTRQPEAIPIAAVRV